MKDFFAVICRNRRALVGMILLGIFLLIAIVGPIIVPLKQLQIIHKDINYLL